MKTIMGNLKFTERIDFTYIVGIMVCFLFSIISVIFYNDSIYPLMLPVGGLFSYLGVVIRGIYDPKTWGTSNKKRRASVLVGYISIFVISFIELFLLLLIGFGLRGPMLRNLILIIGLGLLLISLWVYRVYIKKLLLMTDPNVNT